MKKAVVILLAVLLIVGVIVGAVASEYIILPAYIDEVDIVIDTELFPPRYYLRVVAGGPTTCWEPWIYHTMRFGSIVLVVVLTLHRPDELCGFMVTWEEIIIPLGSCPAMIYTVMVNSVVKTFAVSWYNGIKG